MRILKLTTAVFLLFLTSLASGKEDKRFAVLPLSEAHRVSRLCSRSGVPKIDGSWEPTKADIDGLESRLPFISKLVSTKGMVGVHIAHPATYYRQYVGITLAERRLIYVNAFSDEKRPSDWREKLADYCDGGSDAWGVLYDPTTHEFLELATNGIG
ncbi:MAG TPA: hypothetical protein VN310_18565 [Candidatus Dormibacteraeota bacterium]|jgi:hypothetical protein|nr:hypothetical protein [Candidatus Dormibacteraeota bacterium]